MNDQTSANTSLEIENLGSGLVPGISGFVSAPTTYSMQYLNGNFTYKEKFAVINIGAEYTQGATLAIDGIVDGALAALAGSGAVTAGIGTALAAIADAALSWLESIVFNEDGSVTMQFAYHYCGFPRGGIDPTIMGGLDPNFWEGLVNSLMLAVGVIGRDNQGTLSSLPLIQVNGNAVEHKKTSGIDKIKAIQQKARTDMAFAAELKSNPAKVFQKAGIIIPTDVNGYNNYLFQNAKDIVDPNAADDVTTMSIGCTTCKGLAYTAALGLCAMSAVALAELAVATDAVIVIALADGLGVEYDVALSYIMQAVPVINAGALVVAAEICGYAGCC